MTHEEQNHDLHQWMNEIVRIVTHSGERIFEGIVMTPGPPPYRRLDCDGRALAYLRLRSRKGGIRIDISGLWVPPRRSPLSIPTASGAASLMVRQRDEIGEAVAFLFETVETTRQAIRAQSASPSRPRLRAAGDGT